MNSRSESAFGADAHPWLNLSIIDEQDEHAERETDQRVAENGSGRIPYVMRILRLHDQRKQVSPYPCSQVDAHANAVNPIGGENDYDVPVRLTATSRRWTKRKSLETKQREIAVASAAIDEDDADVVASEPASRGPKVNTVARVNRTLHKETVPLLETTATADRHCIPGEATTRHQYDNIAVARGGDVASRPNTDFSLFGSYVWICGQTKSPEQSAAHDAASRGTRASKKRCCRTVAFAASALIATTLCVSIVALAGGFNGDAEATVATDLAIDVAATATPTSTPIMATEKLIWTTPMIENSSNDDDNDDEQHTTTRAAASARATAGTSPPNRTHDAVVVDIQDTYDQQAIGRCIAAGMYTTKWPLFLDLEPGEAIDAGMLCTAARKSTTRVSRARASSAKSIAFARTRIHSVAVRTSVALWRTTTNARQRHRQRQHRRRCLRVVDRRRYLRHSAPNVQFPVDDRVHDMRVLQQN